MTPRAGHDVRLDALPLQDTGDLDPFLERIGAARIVGIGEASHGTHEFYAWRAELTRRLIAEKGFAFVAVEGDWPDCHRVHCSVTAAPSIPGPEQVLRSFERWPTWMWANEEVLAFTHWLRAHNDGLPPAHRAGFHGLDIYSLFDSLHAVLDYLAEHEPDHLPTAHEALRCFDLYGEDPQSYALASRLVLRSCEDEGVATPAAPPRPRARRRRRPRRRTLRRGAERGGRSRRRTLLPRHRPGPHRNGKDRCSRCPSRPAGPRASRTYRTTLPTAPTPPSSSRTRRLPPLVTRPPRTPRHRSDLSPGCRAARQLRAHRP